MSRKQVVIVGAGFGGLEAAKKLDGSAVDVLLIDRNNFHVFSPLLYQVAASQLNPSDIAYPIRKAFRESCNVRFRQAEVTATDLDARTLTLDGTERLGFDYLVVAAGARTHFFGNHQVARRAMGLKSLSEALQLRNHILGCLEKASTLDRKQQQPWMTFVVVGGGPTGVEYAGALSELMNLVLEKEYPDVYVQPRIVLVEGADQVLGMFSPALGAYTKERLETLGVEVVLDTFVEDYDGDRVFLSGERAPIVAKTLVWSAGVRPEKIAAEADLPNREKSQRISVDRYCRIDGRFDAFAIGDIASFIDPELGELPTVSPPAMQQGRYVADFILSHLPEGAHHEVGGEPRMAPFQYFDKGSMATIGRGHAVASVGNLEMKGVLGWLAWLVVHVWYLVGFRNRLAVVAGWAVNYLFYDRPVRIIARAKRVHTTGLVDPVSIRGVQLPRSIDSRPPPSVLESAE